MSRKDALNSLFLGKPNTPASTEPAALKPDRVRSGAIGAMGTSLKELTEGARAAAKLQEQLTSGDHVVALDPALIDPSSIADRLPAEIDPGFDDLVESLRTHGQQVPVLVRPHPTAQGRFQIAYGRRRLRALVEIGGQVKAIVRTLSDDEMVVAQGRENLDRADLSFIERSLFAKRLEDAGYDRSVIIAALSTDKADLSRYIGIARRIPEDLARRIGPARKAGRARWVSLVDSLDTKANDRLREVLEGSAFTAADSDERFNLVFKAVVSSPVRSNKSSTWTTPEGRKAARIEKKGDRTAITFDDKRAPEFASFVAKRLDALYEEFSNQKGKDEGDR